MKALLIALALSPSLQPILDDTGHAAGFAAFGCTDPLYCEEFTGLPAYADAADVLVDNLLCGGPRYSPLAPACLPDYPLVTLYTAFQTTN